MAKLTLFGINYAPEPSGNAPYTTALAEHLARSGWEVDVHTGFPHYPQWRRQAAPEHEVINGVQIHRHTHHVPSNPSTVGRALMEASWGASVASSARNSEADVVIGIIPTVGGAYAALGAARRSDAPCVLWFQDLVGQAAAQSGIKGAGRVASAVRRIEQSAAGRSDAIIMCADGYRPYFSQTGIAHDRLTVVRNWSTMPPATGTPHETFAFHGLPTDRTVALHSGNMGAKQGLGVVLDAAAAAGDVTWVLQGDGSERGSLETAAADRGLDNVVFLPSLESQDLANLLAAADVLLLTQRPTVTDMSLPSKLTSYLTAGTPIVASIHPQSEAASLLQEAGLDAAVAAGDGGALAQAVASVAEGGQSGVDASSLFGSPSQIERVLVDVMNQTRVSASA